MTEATKYQVFPLDNSAFSRATTPRPSAVAGRTVFTYMGENAGIPVGNAPSILDRDYTITANVTIPSGGAEGVIATEGGRFGGYALMLSPSAKWILNSGIFKAIGACLLILGLLLAVAGDAGKWRKRFGYTLLLVAALGLAISFATDIFQIGRGRPVLVYNFLDLERFRWEGLSSLGEGKHTIVFNFKYDGPGRPRVEPGCCRWTVKRSPANRWSTPYQCSCRSMKPLTSDSIPALRWTLATTSHSASPETLTG
ncbi:hypothetical protein [Edaphobacter aggregans]|uniref:hypothetical protein n=1 Tax=Edaphobacter aggregans TaxID=570835 RepID=UPI000557461B|nr:hypothetical protein [Edaphobacter aggregans]